MNPILKSLVLLLVLSTTALAGERPGALRFSVGIGQGDGEIEPNSRYVYDDYARIPESRPRERGLITDLRLSYTLTPGLRACVETCAWSRHLDDTPSIARLDMLIAGGGVEWLKGPLTMRMVLALGASRVDYLERGIHKDKRDTGSGYLFALGWNKRLGRRLSVGPQFIYFSHLGKDTDVWVDSYGILFNLDFSPGDEQ